MIIIQAVDESFINMSNYNREFNIIEHGTYDYLPF